MELTEHFSLEEFERSTTAIRLVIDNSIPAPAILSASLRAITNESK